MRREAERKMAERYLNAGIVRTGAPGTEADRRTTDSDEGGPTYRNKNGARRTVGNCMRTWAHQELERD